MRKEIEKTLYDDQKKGMQNEIFARIATTKILKPKLFFKSLLQY